MLPNTLLVFWHGMKAERKMITIPTKLIYFYICKLNLLNTVINAVLKNNYEII